MIDKQKFAMELMGTLRLRQNRVLTINVPAAAMSDA